MRARLHTWWRTATFGSERPARRVAALAALGLLTGIAEAAVVLLIVAVASGGDSRLPLDDVLPESVWLLVAITLAVLVALAATHYAAARVAARAGADAQRWVQRALLAAFLDAPWPRQAASRTGELQDLAGPKALVLAHGTHEAAHLVASALNLIVLAGAAVLVSPVTAAGLLVAVGLVVLIARPFRAHRRRVARETAEAAAGLALDLTESASLARDLRVFGAVDAARARLGRAIDAAAALFETLRLTSSATAPLTRDATLLLLVLALALIVEGSDISLAVLGTSVILVLRALSHAQSLASGLHLLEERKANVAFITGRLEAWQPADPPGSQPCPVVDRVELRDVSYIYPGAARPALAGVTLELRRGEQLGIVGATGAGKSTLAAILLGLLKPTSGEVMIGETPLHEIDPAAWSPHIAWVGQEPRLLTGSVADNIRFFRPHLTDAAIHEAAHAAGLAPEVASWERGLEHHVGAAGAELSGGQRQRVVLARALAGRPELLVLDEPTSAQDPHAEAAMRQALDAVGERAIVVVIAHRLSTIRSCDRIAVLDDGRLVALAPPAALSDSNRWFRDAVAHSELRL